MTESTFRIFVNRFVEELRDLAPYDTGNLANDAITFVFTGNEAKIYVNTNIAPYMPYTNEPWLSPKWKGKKNPNEAWWNDSVAKIIKKLSKEFRGVVKNDT